MLNIGVSLIIFLYVTAVCLFALYFILKISFNFKINLDVFSSMSELSKK